MHFVCVSILWRVISESRRMARSLREVVLKEHSQMPGGIGYRQVAGIPMSPERDISCTRDCSLMRKFGLRGKA